MSFVDSIYNFFRINRLDEDEIIIKRWIGAGLTNAHGKASTAMATTAALLRDRFHIILTNKRIYTHLIINPVGFLNNGRAFVNGGLNLPLKKIISVKKEIFPFIDLTYNESGQLKKKRIALVTKTDWNSLYAKLSKVAPLPKQ